MVPGHKDLCRFAWLRPWWKSFTNEALSPSKLGRDSDTRFLRKDFQEDDYLTS